ncbi:hypothetical protein ACTQ6A_01575 [Lachnospiraceae bacterium LCP25S3_G4]
MYEGCKVELQMEQVVLLGEKMDDTVYTCDIVEYNQEEERIFLLLKNNALIDLSLDAKYKCYIFSEEQKLICLGMVKSRYQSAIGNMIEFQIENGFYKNSIN